MSNGNGISGVLGSVIALGILSAFIPRRRRVRRRVKRRVVRRRRRK